MTTSNRSPPPAERRFDRSTWITLAIALLLAAASALVYVAAFWLPVDGWYTDIGAWGRYTAPIYLYGSSPERNPGLREGDVLLAIEGTSFAELEASAARLEPQPPENWGFGEEVRYTVRRGDRDIDVMVALGIQPPPLNDYGPLTMVTDPILISFPLVFVIGAVVFFLRPRQRAAQLLFLYGTAFLADNWMTWMFVTQGPADLFSIWTYWPRIGLGNLLWTAWILPLFLYLFLVFPVVKRPLRRYPRALPLLIFGLGVGASAAFVYANIRGAEDFSFLFVMVYLLPVLVLSVACLLHSAVAVKDPASRAQARWAVLGCSIGMVGPVILWTISGGLSPSTPFGAQVLFLLLTLTLPISLAIAILRYRLWNIDIIINRTLVYGILTGSLALVFYALVTILGSMISAAGRQESSAAFVLSTLAIAALFTPLRRRIQNVIDRRFYRRKYNSEKALADFGLTVRDEVELERLAGNLLGVVEMTLQPESASVWLRETPHTNPGLAAAYSPSKAFRERREGALGT